MCGIVGCILKNNKNAAPVLLDCISKLEYRGYDSSGVAIIENNQIKVVKDKGRVENLASLVNKENLEGSIGIAHTRWATHGEPSDINSHPHGNKRVSIVHNGIIYKIVLIKRI